MGQKVHFHFFMLLYTVTSFSSMYVAIFLCVGLCSQDSCTIFSPPLNQPFVCSGTRKIGGVKTASRCRFFATGRSVVLQQVVNCFFSTVCLYPKTTLRRELYSARLIAERSWYTITVRALPVSLATLVESLKSIQNYCTSTESSRSSRQEFPECPVRALQRGLRAL